MRMKLTMKSSGWTRGPRWGPKFIDSQTLDQLVEYIMIIIYMMQSSQVHPTLVHPSPQWVWVYRGYVPRHPPVGGWGGVMVVVVIVVVVVAAVVAVVVVVVAVVVVVVVVSRSE